MVEPVEFTVISRLLRGELHQVRSLTIWSGFPLASRMGRSVEVQTARVNAPEALPAFKPEMASSTTRPYR